MPTPVSKPQLLAWSPEVATLLGLEEGDVRSPEFAAVFGGNALLPGMEPYSACYGGHQFGNWAGQLGDGRAITLGETVNDRGERWELQLKGAGPTPYSRRADGRAVLRSSVREFLCSEAMHHLGVPTTRALCLVGTGEQVIRDMFYDGNPRPEPGAVVCRVSPSFIRFGNFEIFASRGEEELLGRLVDFTIARDFPEIEGETVDKRIRWFEEVCRRTAGLMAHWTRVGFVHGVMNTDNMSILGLTIDYGPYGWIDNFDPDWTPNTTDAGGRRYRFGHQPQVAHWNLWQLANAIYPVIGRVEPLEAALLVYADIHEADNRRMTMAKLGLADWQDGDSALVADLHRLLCDGEMDMTIFYRRLAEFDGAARASAGGAALFADAFYREDRRAAVQDEFTAWLQRYAARVRHEGIAQTERKASMNAVNPLYVPRNYLAQQAIDAAEQGDVSLVAELLDVFRTPYAEQPGRERFAAKRPDWARHKAGCSMLSCSS